MLFNFLNTLDFSVYHPALQLHTPHVLCNEFTESVSVHEYTPTKEQLLYLKDPSSAPTSFFFPSFNLQTFRSRNKPLYGRQ